MHIAKAIKDEFAKLRADLATARQERDAIATLVEPGSPPALISRIIMRSIENGVRADELAKANEQLADALDKARAELAELKDEAFHARIERDLSDV